jgi:hypothetical protein
MKKGETMEMTIFNTAKHRLETINIEITDENSTWFKDSINTNAVSIITDFEDGLLIKQCNYNYPMWFNDISRADIDHNRQKAQNILKFGY